MDLRVIEQKAAAYRRIAYVPRVVDRDVGPDQSKFAGVAWINQGEPWPACGHCGKPMELFLQLRNASKTANLEWGIPTLHRHPSVRELFEVS